MANKGWDDDIDQRLDPKDGPHGLRHGNRGSTTAAMHIYHLTSLKEQYDNGGEWNTELPGPDRTVPQSPYRTGVIDGANDGINVAAYDGIFGP